MTLVDYVIVVVPVLVFTFWGADILAAFLTRREFRAMRLAVESRTDNDGVIV